MFCFRYKQSKFRKQAGACLWKKLVQDPSMLALCLFIKILLGICLRKRLTSIRTQEFLFEQIEVCLNKENENCH